MSKKGRRGLTPDERALWDKVTRAATPLHPQPSAPKIANKKIVKPTQVKDPSPIAPFRVGEKRTETAPLPLGPVKPAPIKMDQKAFGQLKRGKLKPEARIDLHGMTTARAHPALMTFISDASARGLRLVLVITGKGKDKDDGGPIPTPRGVLRRQVPMWLAAPPLSNMVLQVSEAHLRHGGSGAYYVYLRRKR